MTANRGQTAVTPTSASALPRVVLAAVALLAAWAAGPAADRAGEHEAQPAAQSRAQLPTQSAAQIQTRPPAQAQTQSRPPAQPQAQAQSPAQPAPSPSANVRALTGARTRIVWVQGDGTDPLAAGDRLTLWGLDTDDGRGERAILGTRGSYVKPLMTRTGDRIVFSTRPDPGPPEIFVVNWDGSGLARLAAGFALDVWRDPATGREWVYVGTNNRQYDFAKVVRMPLDDPTVRELVWDRTMVSSDTFQVSADGRSAAGMFPWPATGIAVLPNKSWRTLGDGCWTSLTDIGGTLFWRFDQGHRNLTLVDLTNDWQWVVPINRVPDFHGAEVYHPRWSNHPRFMVMSGPYTLGGPFANKVRAGGTQAEIYLGRFSADFTGVEGWARVSRNTGGDAFPDVWVDRDRCPYPSRRTGRIGPPP